MKLMSRIFLFAVGLFALGEMFCASGQVPNFLAPVVYPVPGASMAVLADVNGDGILDIVTANGYNFKGSGVSVLIGNGDGTFQSEQLIVSGGSPSWILVGDFNNDGKADIAVANGPNPDYPVLNTGGPAANSVSILLGHGDGTFKPSIDTPTLGALVLAAADFNGDGKLDLVVGTGENSAVQVLIGKGDGTFTVSTTTAIGNGFIFTGDFNHDGKQDILADGFELLGNGDGTFGPAVASAYGSALGDFNGDGFLDVAGIQVTGGRALQSIGGVLSLGSQNGTFAQSASGIFTTYGNLVAADFNGDGKLDIFGPGTTQILGPFNRPIGGLFFGNGDGTFIQASPGFGYSLDGPDSISFPAFAAAGDLDSNGSPDVIIANGLGVSVSRNTFGHPPLLAQVTLSGTSVVGGAGSVTGTVSLGGPAPAGGALIALSSTSTSALLPSGKSVTIPAGSRSVTFPVGTGPVPTSTPITVSASYHSVVQNASFTLVPPFNLASLSPVTVLGTFGGNLGTGTVTLSGPASDGVVVSLASANPAVLSVPASVTVAPGSTTATFPMTAQHVPANTVVTVTGKLAGTTRTASVTVDQQPTPVVIVKAEYVVKKGQLTVQATSPNIEPVGADIIPSLRVYNANTGALIGSIRLANVAKGNIGTFTGVLTTTGTLTSIGVQDFAGGLAISAVAQK
jgi:hypothetical protein